MSHYDVIIIGSGAGGGTLARHLAPSGKRILLLERGDWLPREPQNWSTADVFVDNRYVSPDTWYDARRQAVPAAGPLLRRRRHQALRRRAVPAARGGLRRAAPPRRRLARVADRLRRDRAVLHAGRAALPGARRARRGPDRAAGERALPVPGGLATSRASSSSPTTSRPPGYHPFHAPCGVLLDEAEHALQRVRALRRPATASRAWCTRSPTPRCSACARRSSTPTSRCSPTREVVRLETNAAGHAPSPAWWSSATGGRRRSRGDIVVVSCGAANTRQAAARLGERRAPARAGQRLRPGRAQLHVPQQPGGARAVARSPTRRSSRRRSGSTTSTSASDDFEYPLGQHPDGRQVAGADVPRREAAADEARARSGRCDEVARARGRLLALDRGPAAAREPRHARPRRQRHARPTSRPTTCPSSSSTHELKSMLGHLGMHDHLVPRHAYLKNEIPVAGVAHQAGTCRFGTDPADLGARRRLPRARGRQPLRRRHELLPEHRRGEPGADRDGQRAPRRRPPAGAPRGVVDERDRRDVGGVGPDARGEHVRAASATAAASARAAGTA